MADELKKTIKIRGGHRANTTKTLATTNQILTEFNPDEQSPEAAEVEIRLVQQRLNLSEKMATLKEFDEKIVLLIDEQDIEEEMGSADDIRQDIQKTIVRIDSVLGKLQQNSATNHSIPETSQGTSFQQAMAATNSQPSTSKVRLPKLELKHFNGNLMDWAPFWDSYSSAIHENPSLSQVDKFSYLHSLLVNSAAEAIAGLKITSANYDEAIDILKKRFGNQQQIINAHMNSLLNLPGVTDVDNLKGLRQLHDKVESHMRGLKALGVDSGSYGSLFTSILTNKLPQELRLIATKQLDKDQWNLDELINVFKKELDARERANLLQGGAKNPPIKPQNKSKIPSSSFLFSTGTIPTCTYCQQSHPSNSCSVVPDKNARKEILKMAGRCYICLKKNHVARECRSKAKCFKCDKRHHISICTSSSKEQPIPSEKKGTHPPDPLQENPPKPKDSPGKNSVSQSQGEGSSTHVNMFVNAKSSILLQTAQATIYNPNDHSKSQRVRLIFDSGSQRSYITTGIQGRLNLPSVRRDTLMINAFGSHKEEMTSCDMVKFQIGIEGGQKFNLTAYAVPLICSPINNQTTRFAQQTYEHLSGLSLADPANDGDEFDVEVLIGTDYYWHLATGHVVHGNDAPTAMHTKLGWILSGPVKGTKQVNSSNINIASTHILRSTALPSHSIDADDGATETLEAELKRFWELESLGINPNEHSVYEEFLSTVTHQDQRYEVHLPWKDTQVNLPDNYKLSLKRLESLLRRLRQDPTTLKEYDNIIQDQMARGIVEKVDQTDITEAKHVHYLPHHAIIRRDKKTTKLRIVYDASAKSDGLSLNDCLYAGPALSQNIVDILLRFRCHPTALVGDIEKAFLMISVAKEDRDVLRFLWVDNIEDENPKIVTLRFTRVVFGVTASPFLLNGTIKHHIEKYHQEDPQFVQQFLDAIYVDDLSSGAEDDDTAYELYVKSKQRLSEGGFNLRKFLSNSLPLMQRIQQNEDRLIRNEIGQPTTDVVSREICNEDETYSRSTVGNLHDEPLEREEKILGIRWNYANDTFIFNFQRIVQAARERKPTKRNVIGIISSFYDPLGVLAPTIVKLKMFFQELCESKIDWDEELTDKVKKKWEGFILELENSEPTTIPRCHLAEIKGRVISYNLLGFCDASIRAYGAVIYLKITTTLGTFLKFVIAKTRVSPINKQSIPRLELLSGVVLARLITTVKRALQHALTLDDPTCWTDSKVALYWIRGVTQEWKQFIQNRVIEIRRLVPPVFWKHCPGKGNPADVASRGINPTDLATRKMWLNGPEWVLQNDTSEDKSNDEDSKIPEECVNELKAKERKAIQNTCSLISAEASYHIQNVIEAKGFSSFQKLVRVTSLVLRFIRRLKNAHRARIQDDENGDVTINTETEIAEALWLKQIQSDVPRNSAFDTWTKQFGLFWDENGIIRCKGRISKANISDETKYPILLSTKNRLTELIVRESHKRVFHNGVKETLAELRSKFWIIRGRQFVRRVIHNCVVCKKHEGPPYSLPAAPPLPEFRTQREQPFSSTGIDFAGPLYVKEGKHCKTQSKTWISLYTCAVTRALHLDLVSDMTSEAFLLSFRRFCARRGVPKRIISDNAKTFLTASRRLTTLFDLPEVRQQLDVKRIKWSFNVAKAPWQGGFFERLVKSVKRCLKKALGRACVTYEELLTVLTEIECVLNSRPLSYVSTEDLEEPLTPSHLLCGRRLLSLPCGDPPEPDPDWSPKAEDVTKRAIYLQKLIDHFWKRWSKEYLLELRESHRYASGDKDVKGITVGEMVVIHDENRRRGSWKMGRVEGLIQSKDNKNRAAIVRVSNGEGKTSTLRRPINKLYPLEVSSQTQKEVETINIPTEEVQAESEEISNDDQKKSRPRRRAAIVADLRRQQWLQD